MTEPPSAVGSPHRPPYATAAGAAALIFTLYAWTLAPTTAFWDTSEYIATAHILGIPHPPGNPLFVALGKVWILLTAPLGFTPLGLSVAQRINLLAAFTSAAAFGFFFLIAFRILLPLLGGRTRALVGSGISVLIGSTTYTVWTQSNANEKVYTVSLLIIALVSWLVLRWHERREEPESLRLLLLALYLMVVGSTNHLMSLLPLPALGLLVLGARPRILLERSLWLAGAGALVVGLSFNFFLPIRAAQDPVINEGEPVCGSVVGAAAAVYTQGRSGCPALGASLTREQYRKPPLTERQAPLGHQFLNWFQYLDWQWARGADPDPVPGNGRLPFTLVFLALAGIGFRSVARADRSVFLYLATLGALLTVALVYYLNFEYGYALAPEVRDPQLHEVRERDYFFVAGFALLGVAAGIGLSVLWGWLAARASRGARPWLLASPLLVLAGIPLVFNAAWADRSGEYAARDYAYNLLMSVEPYAVLFTNGDNDTFPLWYLQEVEGIRRDVTVIVGQYLETAWYPGQLNRLTAPCEAGEDPAEDPTRIVCQRPFDLGSAGASPDYLADAAEEPAPDTAILELTDEEIDGVAGAVLPRDSTVELGGYGLVYPEGSYLTRGELLTLRIIQDSLSERPVYFSNPMGVMRNLSLDRWGVRHGLATKLELRRIGSGELPGVVRVPPELGGEWYHVPRSTELVEEVYRLRDLPERAIWRDMASSSIPAQYYFLYRQLAGAVAERDPESAVRYAELADRFLAVALGGAAVVDVAELDSEATEATEGPEQPEEAPS